MNKSLFISFLFLIALATACSKKDEENDVEPVNPYSTLQDGLDDGASIAYLIQFYSIEDFYGLAYEGGLIFYIDVSNYSGMVAMPFDQSDENNQFTGAPWRAGDLTGNNFVKTDTTIGIGGENTLYITNKFDGEYFAAKLCDDLSYAGYNDWFLPSKNELEEMYTNLHLNGMGNFNGLAVYWSSSGSINDAWYLFFQTGNQEKFGTLGTFYVRAAREFQYKKKPRLLGASSYCVHSNTFTSREKTTS